MLCSETTSVNRNNAEGACAILRCKRWSCEICQPFNRSRVIHDARRGHPRTFLTLTCNPHRYETPDEAARDMRRALVMLRRSIETKYELKNMPFLVVFEKTKRGWPHMHILCRAPWINQEWLSNRWEELTGAKIVDIRRIKDNAKAYYYVTKYIGKQLSAFKGCKRWWRSHNYNIDEKEERPKVTFGARWEVVERRWCDYIADLKHFGYELRNERPGYAEFIKPAPW